MSPLTPSPLQLYGAAVDAVRSREPEVLLCGPAGTGKSLAWLYKLHRAAQRYPGMRGLIVRNTRESLTQSGLVTFESKILSPRWRALIADNCQRRVRQSYRYPNGSELVVGGLDKPTKVMSTEFDLIYVQEATETAENAWESLTTRLRNGVMPYQQLVADTNPDSPNHWLKKRCDAGRVRLLESRHEDNPSVTPEYLAKLDALTGVRYLRLRKGLWAGSEGLIYDEYDPAVHLVDALPEGWQQWRKIRAIDFGYTNPFTCQWWAIDPDGRMWLYRELYGTKRLVADWAEQIKTHSEGESYELTVADHDAEDRATLHAAGIPTVPAYKAVKEGIEAVSVRLRRAGDGRPRLQFLRSALVDRDSLLADAKKPTSVLEEIESYSWLPPVAGRPPKEEPRKLDDHGIDAVRYAVCAIDGIGYYSAGAA